MQIYRKIIAVVLMTAMIISVGAGASFVSADDATLSPYWEPVVSRWEKIVCRYARGRGLDPDLVAAVIWKESLGQATAEGPTGAVGLMGLKPFPWRPSPEELEKPWANVAWGSKTLSHIIRDGKGDVFYSLAAYNGGWDQIHLRVTRRYATSVLGHYVRAVAVRHGLPAEGGWFAILAVEGLPDANTVTVLGPQRPLARYTERPWLEADVPSVPDGYPPHATVVTFVDERGIEGRVNLWLVSEDGSLVGAPSTRALPSTTSLTGDGPYGEALGSDFRSGLPD